MQQYLELVQHILTHGEKRSDRTHIGTLSVFGTQTKYDLRDGFPLLTTKKIFFSTVVRELLWFLKGSTNIQDNLTQHTSIWDAWADKTGDLGPIYGHQWRFWEKFTWNKEQQKYQKESIDQISQAIEMIKSNPTSRRIIVSAWNVADIEKMAIPPCHSFFQFYVVNGRLDCQLYQRSADIALGFPFNIASYALLITMIAQECQLTPGIFTHTIGDAHIYLNHIEGLKEQLTRTPQARPQVTIAPKPLFDIEFENITLHNYSHAPFIEFPIAV